MIANCIARVFFYDADFICKLALEYRGLFSFSDSYQEKIFQLWYFYYVFVQFKTATKKQKLNCNMK